MVSRPSGRVVDEGQDLGGGQCLSQLLLGRVRLGVEKVGADAVVEEVGVLGHHADHRMRAIRSRVAHVHAEILTAPARTS